jgi:hypothetical protein
VAVTIGLGWRLRSASGGENSGPRTGERGDGQLTRQGLEEYVSDCGIQLDNRVEDQITTRRLRS